MRRFFIYAGTAEQARSLAMDMGLRPDEWTYVLTVEWLIKTEEKPILMYGTWRERDDIRYLEQVATERQMKIFYIIRGGCA
jgi:hypothetical protein